jgi:hypothetical protein
MPNTTAMPIHPHAPSQPTTYLPNNQQHQHVIVAQQPNGAVAATYAGGMARFFKNTIHECNAMKNKQRVDDAMEMRAHTFFDNELSRIA